MSAGRIVREVVAEQGAPLAEVGVVACGCAVRVWCTPLWLSGADGVVRQVPPAELAVVL